MLILNDTADKEQSDTWINLANTFLADEHDIPLIYSRLGADQYSNYGLNPARNMADLDPRTWDLCRSYALQKPDPVRLSFNSDSNPW